jgi:hypothetical protein
MNKLLTLILLVFCLNVAAQVDNTKLPYGYTKQFKNQPVKLIAPYVDVDSYILEDRLNEAEDFRKPYRFGIKIPVDLNLFNSGTWTTLENGDRIWRLNFKSTGARTLNLMLDRFDLPEGAELFVYDKQRTNHIGPYTEKENQEDGFLGTWVVYGDDIIIEYYEPAAVKGLGRVSIDKIVHGYRGFGKAEESFLKLNESGACNVDVNCNPNAGSFNGQDWTTVRDQYRHAVARIIINGSGLCTGTLVNNVRNDGTPYFLTANHCLGLGPGQDGFGSNYPATNWVFGFDWFATTGARCATFLNTTGPFAPTRTISGATLRANRYATDVALFELNATPPSTWDLFYAGWNRSTTPSSSQLSVHHPSGDIMKLARNDQSASFVTISGISCWNIANWDYGVTEGGSSGGCLIDQNGFIVGQLLGGGAACSGTNDNGAPDWYGRFDLSWSAGSNNRSRLRDWLDPDTTNPVTHNGSFTSTLSTGAVSLEVTEVIVYPNPSNGRFKVDSDTNFSYQIFDLQGRVVSTGQIDRVRNTINLTTEASGVYFMKVLDRETSAFKLIKE